VEQIHFFFLREKNTAGIFMTSDPIFSSSSSSSVLSMARRRPIYQRDIYTVEYYISRLPKK